jgi:hypothetical protein
MSRMNSTSTDTILHVTKISKNNPVNLQSHATFGAIFWLDAFYITALCSRTERFLCPPIGTVEYITTIVRIGSVRCELEHAIATERFFAIESWTRMGDWVDTVKT